MNKQINVFEILSWSTTGILFPTAFVWHLRLLRMISKTLVSCLIRSTASYFLMVDCVQQTAAFITSFRSLISNVRSRLEEDSQHGAALGKHFRKQQAAEVPTQPTIIHTHYLSIRRQMFVFCFLFVGVFFCLFFFTFKIKKNHEYKNVFKTK